MADTDDLYQEFIDVAGCNGALDKANLFENLTDAHLHVLLNFKAKGPMEVMLREERNTWRLAKALLKDQLLGGESVCDESNRMDDSGGAPSVSMNDSQQTNSQQNGNYIRLSEDQIIGNYYVIDEEIRRMQLVTDWLEANASSDLDYQDEEDKAEFYAEGPVAWENTFHAMRATYSIDILDLDITINPNAGVDLCNAMDPDAPIRTKKSLAHQDKEIELRLFKHLFRFIRAGKLDEGQELAQRVGYHWLSAILEGWLPYSDPNLDQENINGISTNGVSNEIKPITGNKKRDVWKNTCFKAAKMHGLNSCEKAILGVLGGNIRCVLPVCHNWSDQLWARLKCSIDVKIEKALRDPNVVPQENRDLIDMPEEFYDNYQNLGEIFKSIRDQKIVSSYKEATIHQTIQRYLILNDIDGLLNQLADWCSSLDYDTNEGAVSPHFLRCFAHIVLFLRELDLVDCEDERGTKILEAYISLLTHQKSIESVAYYSSFLPKDNQTMSFAKLLATIIDKEERRHCLIVAKESGLDVDEITQTVVELIRDEKQTNTFPTVTPTASSLSDTKTTSFDKRKIDALDYMLLLDTKNYIAILYHGNILMRHFALQKKIDAMKETYLKLPTGLAKNVESQWQLHANCDITPSLRNNLRELEAFRALLDAQEELSQWSEWHHKRPQEPSKPANLTKFCDNVNYEQRLKQYQQDLNVWRNMREARTGALTDKISKLLYFTGGWMIDLPTDTSDPSRGQVDATDTRTRQLKELRQHFIPHMIFVSFSVLQLIASYEDCLKLSHLLVQEDLQLYKEFSKVQLREFLSKISEVAKLIVEKELLDK